MKIGPFTPPDVRAAIEQEIFHWEEQPKVVLSDIDLCIAGFTLRIHAHEGYPLTFVSERLIAPFRCQIIGSPDFEFHCQVSETFNHVIETAPGHIEGKFQNNSWSMHSSSWRFVHETVQQKVHVVYCGIFASLLVAIRLFLAHKLLAHRRGLMMHGAAVIVDDRAFVFLGPSKAGKSTSVYTAGGQILADDAITVIRANDGSLLVQGTPFGGEHFPSSMQGNSPTFLFIEKSDRNLRTSLPPRNQFARLLSQTALHPQSPFQMWDAAGELVEHIISQCPVEVLEARRDGSFWKDCLL